MHRESAGISLSFGGCIIKQMCIFSHGVPTEGTVPPNCYCCCGIVVCSHPRTTLRIAVAACSDRAMPCLTKELMCGCCICLAAQLLEILVCKYHCRTGLAQDMPRVLVSVSQAVLDAAVRRSRSGS